jgi:hypothetical protein
VNTDSAWRHLDLVKERVLANSLAPTTLKTYRAGFNQYLQFCRGLRLAPFPVREQVLENFCVSMAQRVGYLTLKVYCCAIQAFSRLRGFPECIKDMVRLPYVLRGIRRLQGATHTRLPRSPVTLLQLHQMLSHLATLPDHFTQYMLSAAVLLAFFGLLRVSEYTSPASSAFDGAVQLTPSDVVIFWQRRLMLVRLKVSKTDPFGAGVVVRVAATGNRLCPLMAMLRYLAVRGVGLGPLFFFPDGSFLTRAHVMELLRSCFPLRRDVTTHSFRRGGASALASWGVPPHVIQILGRWRSDAYRRYIHVADDYITGVTWQMARSPPAPPGARGPGP